MIPRSSGWPGGGLKSPTPRMTAAPTPPNGCTASRSTEGPGRIPASGSIEAEAPDVSLFRGSHRAQLFAVGSDSRCYIRGVERRRKHCPYLSSRPVDEPDLRPPEEDLCPTMEEHRLKPGLCQPAVGVVRERPQDHPGDA